RSPYSAGGEHGSDLEVRSSFGPLFERYGVQLVLSAHEHIYERTLPMREGSSGSPVTYIVTGGGGGPLYPAGTAAWTAYSASRHHYLRAAVGTCTLQVTAIGLDGSPFDGTTLNRCAAPPSVTLTSPAAGATYTAPATVTLAATIGNPGAGIAKVQFYAGTTLLGTSTSAPYGFTWTTVPAGTYSLTAVATDTAGASALSAAVSITVNAAPATLPPGWTHSDIGATGVAGDATYSSGVYTVRGAGADVWGMADALHYAYTSLTGNGSIVARVTSIQNVNAWTKAGVMIRNSASPSAAQAFMLVASSATKGVPFQRRPADGASSVGTSGSQSTAPRWVKLVRAGSLITGYESADGASWVTVGSDTFTMGATVLVGLAVSSHLSGVNAAATFDNVVVSTTTGPPNVFPSVSMTSPANGATGTAPAAFTLSASASDSDGSIAKVDFYAGATLVGTASASPYTVTWTNVPSGAYQLTAVATDNAGAGTTSAPVSVIVTAPQPPADLPPGWSSADVGNEPFPGSARASNGTFTVKGSGADVWGTSDQFHYAYRPLSGDGSIVARVASLENVSSWVKAGVMIRETLAPGSAHAFMLVSPSKGVAFQRRPAANGASVGTGGTTSTAPRWVKLTRAGQTFTAYESANGSAWTVVGTETIPMGGTVLIGLAVTSHNTGATATCTFDSVTVQ
ncbi:MAG: Ig-like domain-containing protein, partial [Acidobacteriota bacterium]